MHPSWEFNPPNANDFQEKNTFEKKKEGMTGLIIR